nr:MAG TPA: hypothetical protein [Caudoviricetes sp.]
MLPIDLHHFLVGWLMVQIWYNKTHKTPKKTLLNAVIRTARNQGKLMKNNEVVDIKKKRRLSVAPMLDSTDNKYF